MLISISMTIDHDFDIDDGGGDDIDDVQSITTLLSMTMVMFIPTTLVRSRF